MQIWPDAKLYTSIPDDHVWRDDDDCQIGGQAVARVIAQALQNLGYETDDPQEEPDHGWYFDVKVSKKNLTIHLSQGENKVYMNTSYGNIFNKKDYDIRLIHGNFLIELNNLLKNDTRFTDISWYNERYRGVVSDIPFKI